VTCKRMTADDGHEDWTDLCVTNGSARVSAELRPTAGRRGVARNALDERFDDIEYAGKLLDERLEHTELDSQVSTWATQRTYALIGCTRDRARFSQ